MVQSGFWCKKHIRLLFIRLICHNSKGIDWQRDGTNQTCKIGEIEFKHGDQSQITAISGNFGQSGFSCKEEIRQFWNLMVCKKLKTSDWDLDGRNRASTHGKTCFSKSRWFKKNSRAFPEYQIFYARIRSKNFSIEYFSKAVGNSTETLMGKTKPVATQNVKFDDLVRSSSKSSLGSLAQSGFWCKEHNRLVFIRLICHNSKGIDWDLDEKIKRVVWETIEFEHRNVSKVI